MFRHRSCWAALLLVLVACGDDATGPDDEDPDFPTLDAGVTAEFCIRGSGVPTTSLGSDLSTGDCPTVFPVGIGPNRFYETWRVRVGSPGTVAFEVTSGFDSFLSVFRMAALGSPELGADNLVLANDDSGEGDDALLLLNLQPGVEYWVMVSGFEASETGPYTLEVRTQ